MVEHVACPACQKKGRDTSGDNLAVYTDGSTYCFACGYSTRDASSSLHIPPMLLDTDLLDYKGISRSTLELWEFGELLEEDRDGTLYESGVVVMPYYDHELNLVGVKYRDVYSEQEKKRKKKDTVWMQGSDALLGWHTHTGKDECVLVEGETDALYAHQFLYEKYDILCIPGSKKSKLVQAAIPELKKRFKQLYVFTDADAAGDKLRRDLQEVIPVYLAKYADYRLLSVNDMCDIKNPDDIHKLVERSKGTTDRFLLTGTALLQEHEEWSRYSGTRETWSTGFSTVDVMLGGGLTRQDVLLLVGHSGTGKTTFASDVVLHLAEHTKVLYIPTEMSAQQTLRKLHSMKAGLPMRQLEEFAYDEDVKSALSFIADNIVFYSKKDYSWESLKDAIIASQYQNDVGVVVIDVLQNIHTFGDWLPTKQIMREIEEVSEGDRVERRKGLAFILVSHTKYTDGRFAQKITRSSIAGGTTVLQQVTCALAFEESPDYEDERVLSLVKKDRFNDERLSVESCTVAQRGQRYKEVVTGKAVRKQSDNKYQKIPLRRNKANNTDDN